MLRILSSIILVLILFSASFSRENFGNGQKIVFIDKYQFEIEKTGIKKFAHAYNFLDLSSCFPLNWSKISKIEVELRNPNLQSDERLKKELLLKDLLKEQIKDHERRGKKLTAPIYQEISDSIKEIETRKGLKIIFVDEAYENSSLLFYDEKLDITRDFIDSFNDFEKDFGSLGSKAPQSKIALFNTERFFDKDKGLIRLFFELEKVESIFNKSGKTVTEAEKLLQKDYSSFLDKSRQEIIEFSQNKGFNIVFDSSRKFTQQLQNVDSEDFTEEFIIYFNNKYPKIEEK